MAVSPALPLQHLPCSIEDEMVIQQPTSYFGHGCFTKPPADCAQAQRNCAPDQLVKLACVGKGFHVILAL